MKGTKSLSTVGASRDARGRAGAVVDDRIERSGRKHSTHWDTALIWFMRIVALIWLGKGVLSWASILDAIPGMRPFEAESFGRQGVIVYFAVMDFTAAVGLWLTSAWGGVVWLLAATSALTLAILTPHLLPMPPWLLAVVAGIVVVYFVLSWLAAQDAQ